MNQVKVCISSRPEPLCVDRLHDLPSLKLHELNSGDILRVVQQNFLQDRRVIAIQSRQSSRVTESGIEELAQEIKIRSNGVFLWVHLVIKDLLKGVSNEDNLQKLSRRLERLPVDIMELYKDMLRRSQNDASLYEEDISLYLSRALHKEFDLLEFCFAIDGNLRHKFLQSSILDHPAAAIAEVDCDRVKTWIEARTAGLLEVHEYNSPVTVRSRIFMQVIRSQNHILQGSHILKHRASKVWIVHRTARDFLRNTDTGASLLRSDACMGHEINDICFQTRLIDRLILPGLLGFCVSVTDASTVFHCDGCEDEDICAGLSNHGDKFFRFLASRWPHSAR